MEDHARPVEEQQSETSETPVSSDSHVWEKISPGTVLSGKVSSLHNFGVFIDLGGIEGLVHISEVSNNFVKHPSEVVQVGQEVQVKVLKADPENQRVSLSMKAVQDELWKQFGEQHQNGDTIKGTIKRKTDFGIFVEVLPGIEGLLHVSQLHSGAQYNDPEYDVGREIEARIRLIDVETRRLQLTQRDIPEQDPWENIAGRIQEGEIIEGKVDGMTKFGLLAEIEPGLTGLIPFSALKKMGYKKPTKSYPQGSVHRFKVANLDIEKRRLALVPELSAAERMEAQAKEASEKNQKNKKKAQKVRKKPTPKPAGMTEFGALLAAALSQEKTKD